MGLIDRMFGRKPAAGPPEHAVIVEFVYGSTDLSRLFELEEQLERAILTAKAGELDGNEVAADGSDASLYMYGPAADALFAAVRPILERSPMMKGARVTLRYGRPGDDVPESHVTIT